MKKKMFNNTHRQVSSIQNENAVTSLSNFYLLDLEDQRSAKHDFFNRRH
jgi:hypothetical protein